MKRIFIDANIVIDLLCERYPWFPNTLRIFSMADFGEIELYCSSLSLGTASYLMETKKMTSQEIFENINLFCQICTPTTVDASVVKNALDSDFKDFEDALQHYSALTVNAECIITRNKKDFSSSVIPIYELNDFIAYIEESSQ
ncbi:MAG: PIN domain-containing protein [Prevotella sp.]|nr:PIN domain-containing protein [Prevotella sp.]